MAGDQRGTGLRLGFAGTPDFAATILGGLLESEFRPAVVYTQPDRASGRGRRLRSPPVKADALRHGLEVRQPRSLNSAEVAAALAQSRLDVLVVAAYGLILPSRILTIPRLGCINVHASLLPRWRGAAPVERAILAGDRETGVSIMQMDAGLDTGPVYLHRRCPITPETDGPGLEERLAGLGRAALLECLGTLADRVPQPQGAAGVTYAPKLTRADAAIDWSQSADTIERQVRALRGRMPAFTRARGARLAILCAAVVAASSNAAPGTVVAADRRGIRVACGRDLLEISRLQLDVGKGRPLSAADALNGYAALFAVGSLLGSGPGNDP